MTNTEDWERFFKLRETVFEKIRAVDDGYHKSYEGAMDVLFGFNNVFESKSVRDTDVVEIELHCYLLLPNRHMKWAGKTFKEALDKAEYDLKWILDLN